MTNIHNILTIDDDLTILDAYASILAPYKKTSLEDAILRLEQMHDIECSVIEPAEEPMHFNVFQADSGLDGVALFKKNYEEGVFISVCIVDMRMPNGIDGLETSLRLKEIDPNIHIIIATAYSDRTSKEILDSLKNNTYYIRKPFNNEEIYQLVHSLSISYCATKTIRQLNIDLEREVQEELEKNRQKDLLLFQQSKYASMGEMISNIAHQWRQPLNVLSMLFQKIDRMHKNKQLDDVTMQNTSLQAIDTIEHMSQTIDSFRNHFKPNREKGFFNLSCVINESILLIKPSFDALGIKLETMSESPLEIYGFAEDFKQVLINLLNNAKDAVLSKNITNGEVFIDIKALSDNSAIYIAVNDNGGGIEDIYIDKIFEPYFTTKHKAQGTGIGLYMSKRIIEEHFSGFITAHSTKENTSFTILIPTKDKDNHGE